jgi:hypothetical protein
VVADGETVGISENAAGWTDPTQAKASCQSSENATGGIDRLCSIGLTNVEREVLGSTTDPLAPVTSADRPGDPENPGDPVSPGPSVPTGESLAFTGFDLIRYAIGGLTLLLVGLSLLIEARRRTEQATD